MTQIDRITGLRSSTAIKAPCMVATTATIVLLGEQTIDGVAVIDGDRVLVKSQTDGTQNGIYIVSTGIWSRAPDMNSNDDVVKGTSVRVTDGAVGQGVYVVTTSDPITIDTGNLVFTSASALPAGALLAASNLGDIANKQAAIDNLTQNGASIISANPLVLSTATGDWVDVTGGTSFSSVTLAEGDVRFVRHTGAPLITVGASLVVNGSNSVNYQVTAGEEIVYRGYSGGVVRAWSIAPKWDYESRRPSANDGAALGAASFGYSDLFLASGAVINFNGGDVTITHAANALTFNGASSGYVFDENVSLSTGAKLTLTGAPGVSSSYLVGASTSTAAINVYMAELGTAGGTGSGLLVNRASSDGFVAAWYRAAALVGSVSVTGVATAYNTSSDGRLKLDRKDFDSGKIIDGIEMFEHTWLHVRDSWSFGAEAQKVYELVPSAVFVGSSEGPGDDAFLPWAVDYSKLVPIMWREIQSLRERIAKLEDK